MSVRRINAHARPTCRGIVRASGIAPARQKCTDIHVTRSSRETVGGRILVRRSEDVWVVVRIVQFHATTVPTAITNILFVYSFTCYSTTF